MRLVDNFTNYRQSKLLRIRDVNIHCPVCLKPDWCLISEDKSLVICMRTSTGSIKTSANGGYVHILKTPINIPVYSTIRTYEVNKSAVNRLHKIYSYMLRNCFVLTNEDQQSLLNRGLSEKTIKHNNYKSSPRYKENFISIAEKLKERYKTLEGIPGFYKDEEDNWQLLSIKGIYIPVRDAKGNIRGIQIRRYSKQGPKYVWLSTPNNKYKDGSASGAELHFAKSDNTSVIITEGPLKADCINEFTGQTVIALPGVSTIQPERISRELRKYLSETQNIIIAFDNDFHKNIYVKQALLKLANNLQTRGFNVKIRTWKNYQWKGYDDLLLNNKDAKVIDYNVQDFEYVFCK
jgi:DNA primase